MNTPKFPMPIKKSSCTATIYRRENKGYQEFTLPYYRRMQTGDGLREADRLTLDVVANHFARGR